MPMCSPWIFKLIAAPPARSSDADIGAAMLLMIVIAVLLGTLLLVVVLLTARRAQQRRQARRPGQPPAPIDAWTESGRRLRPLDQPSERRDDA